MLFEASRKSSWPAWDQEDINAVLPQIAEVLKSGRLILGEHTEALEQEFADFIGTKYAVALSSCTAALEIALGLNWFPRANVVMPSCGFVATAAAGFRTGYSVRYCDIDERDFCLDAWDAVTRMTRETRAVVVTHLAGFVPHDFQRLLDECAERGIWVIEDCSHAHGARFDGRPVGSFGEVGCFSFYATKIMTCGVGGMLTTNNLDVYERARRYRHHGAAGGTDLTLVTNPGNDYLMDEMRAVLTRHQLTYLADTLLCRREAAREYDRALELTPVRAPIAATNTKPAYYKYPVLLPPDAPDAATVREKLLSAYGIETGTLYNPPIHQQPAYLQGAHLPTTEAMLRRQICLPMHDKVYPDDCQEIVNALLECLE